MYFKLNTVLKLKVFKNKVLVLLIFIHPLVTLSRLLAHFSLDFSQFYNLWQLILLCLAALINCRLTWQLNSSPLPPSLSRLYPQVISWLSIAQCRRRHPRVSLVFGKQSNQLALQLPQSGQLKPTDQTTKRPPSHTDNDRVIALNPSIKRGHHDIVAPPAAKLARLPPLPKKKISKLAALIVDNINNNIQICQLPS